MADTDDPTPTQPAASGSIPLHDLLGFEFSPPEPGDTFAEVTMPVRPQALGFTANLHGGAIATLVDLACALAAARASGFDPMKETLVTADMHVRYLGTARTDSVVARADVVRAGRQLIVVECKVRDGDHIIASADFSMMIVPLREPSDATAVVVAGGPQL